MPRPARTREDPELRRAHILQEAIGVIGERGYYGFKVQELARRCNLSNAGLLHYFPSKDAILVGVLSELEAREIEIMTPLVKAAEKARDGDEPKKAALLVLRTMVVRASAQPELGRLVAELQTESLNPAHPGHSWWESRQTALVDLIVSLIGHYVDPPYARARLMIAMMDGLWLQWLQADQNFDVVAEWESALTLLLPEFGSGGPPRRTAAATRRPVRRRR